MPSRGPTTAAGGSRSSSEGPAHGRGRRPIVASDEADRVVIEQSEIDAAIAAVRSGVRARNVAEEQGPRG